MREFVFCISYNGIEGYIRCHAGSLEDAEAIFTLMGLHDGLGNVI